MALSLAHTNFIFSSDEVAGMEKLDLHAGRGPGPFVALDWQSFSEVEASYKERVAATGLDVIASHIQKCGLNTTPKIFLHAKRAVEAIYAAYPHAYSDATDEQSRSLTYGMADFSGKAVPLSQMFDSKLAMCAELALLSQRLLGLDGIKSDLICGSLRLQKPGEPPQDCRHFWLAIPDGSRVTFFDPATCWISNGKAGTELRSVSKADYEAWKDALSKGEKIAIGAPHDTPYLKEHPEVFYGFAADRRTPFAEETQFKTCAAPPASAHGGAATLAATGKPVLGQ